MARKSAQPIVTATFPVGSKKAKPRRRRVSTFNPRAWAKDRIETAKRELAMYDAIHEVLEYHRRKLGKKIKREEKDLAEGRAKPVPEGCCS